MQQSASQSSTIIATLLLCSPRQILPCRTKSPSCTCQETLFLVFLRVLIKLVLVQLGRPEECRDEDNQVHA